MATWLKRMKGDSFKWSGPSLKGKLNSLEMRNAMIGTEISKGTFGPIIEVTLGNEKYNGQQLDTKTLVVEQSKKSIVDKFPYTCTWIYSLDHANVVKLCGVVINNAFLPVLVTEQLGSPLSEYLLKKHAKPTAQMSILRDVAHGLQYLHCLPNPVLHLCLTPENIVINPDTCQAKIFNPGVVNLLQLTPSWCQSNLPRADCFLPQLEAAMKPDPSIDIFSYGALMIHVFQPQQEPICPPVFLQDPQDSNKITMNVLTVDDVMAQCTTILCKVLETHPMYSLVQKCLMKLPSARPTIIDVVKKLENENDIISKMNAWEKDIQEKTQKWVKQSSNLTITVTGSTGSGKTSLMNGLLGKEVGKEGCTLSFGSTHVESFQAEIQGVWVTIWHTSAFQDGVCKGEECLKYIFDSGCVDANLKVYCISIVKKRLASRDMKILSKFTTKFGVKFWERCLFVLTFANGYAGECPLTTDEKMWLYGRIDQWRNCIKSELLKAGVEDSVVEQIPIVPAGYHRPLQMASNPWKLPGIENWFYLFWCACAKVIDSTALAALVKLNRRRFKKDKIKNNLREIPLAVKVERLFSIAHVTQQQTKQCVKQEESVAFDTAIEKEQSEDNSDASEEPSQKKATTISKTSDNADQQVTREAKQKRISTDPPEKEQSEDNSDATDLPDNDSGWQMNTLRPGAIAIIVVLLAVCAAGVIHYSQHGASFFKNPFSSTKHPIPSINELINELPAINDIPSFCACLKIDFGRCQQIQSDKPMNMRQQLIGIADEWYQQSHDRNWEDFVKALICYKNIRVAVELANKVGVDWKLLQSELKL